MMNSSIQREEAAKNIFAPNASDDTAGMVTPNAPIMGYNGYLDPQKDANAVQAGDQLVSELGRNRIADFEKNLAYCEKNGCDHPDCMVHVSTFKILDGVIYMTYYANTANDQEDPAFQEARLAFCPVDAPQEMTIFTIQKVGELLDGRKIDRLYDTILMHKGGDELYLMWTASVEGLYYRLYCVYHISTKTLSAIRPNRFRVGHVTNDFSTTGIISALTLNHLPYKEMFSDIGIMQKLTMRMENGVPTYYTGAYSGYLNFVIKSTDLITWEYVSAPDFINLSMWENATYVLGDKCYYFVRQFDCHQGFLTCLDLNTGKWSAPCLVRDAQSRSDFIYYQDQLYLIHAPVDRNGFGIVRVDRQDLSQSRPVAVANMHDSLFYPYVDVLGDDAYISYTVNRKHIRLSKFHLPDYVG